MVRCYLTALETSTGLEFLELFDEIVAFRFEILETPSEGRVVALLLVLLLCRKAAAPKYGY